MVLKKKKKNRSKYPVLLFQANFCFTFKDVQTGTVSIFFLSEIKQQWNPCMMSSQGQCHWPASGVQSSYNGNLVPLQSREALSENVTNDFNRDFSLWEVARCGVPVHFKLESMYLRWWLISGYFTVLENVKKHTDRILSKNLQLRVGE